MKKNTKVLNHTIILFDGVCNLCNGFVQFIIERDKDEYFKFASLQSEAAKEILKPFGLDNESLNTVILVEKGKEVDLKNLSQPFWKKDSARTNKDHHGLGLSLVKLYTNLLGGDLRFSLSEGNQYKAVVEMSALS